MAMGTMRSDLSPSVGRERLRDVHSGISSNEGEKSCRPVQPTCQIAGDRICLNFNVSGLPMCPRFPRQRGRRQWQVLQRWEILIQFNLSHNHNHHHRHRQHQHGLLPLLPHPPLQTPIVLPHKDKRQPVGDDHHGISDLLQKMIAPPKNHIAPISFPNSCSVLTHTLTLTWPPGIVSSSSALEYPVLSLFTDIASWWRNPLSTLIQVNLYFLKDYPDSEMIVLQFSINVIKEVFLPVLDPHQVA